MLIHHIQKRILLLILVILTCLYILKPLSSNIFTGFYYFLHPEESIQCYHIKAATLPDISEVQITKGKSIFFHETSCSSYFNGKITITARQACAVESAAKLNPNYDVYLLYAAPGIFKFDGTESDRFLQALLEYGNVKIHHLDYKKYTKDSPVEELYSNGAIDGSVYAQSHASDVLRYLTLWRYGGIYLDLDVIVTKSLEPLPANYAGSESERNVAAGVLSFSPEGKGHRMAEDCLIDLKNNFKGHDWGYNGPGVITRLLRKQCGEEDAKNMINKDCNGFKVFPIETFYPVPWWNWTLYFDESFTQNVLNLSQESFVIHVWNKHSVHNKVHVESGAPYVLFAQKFCPKVFKQCGELF